MDHSREQKVVGSFHTEQHLADFEVSAAADREKLCQPLYKSEKYSFKPLHYSSSLFLKTFMMATTSITMPKIMTIGAATILRKSNIS